MQTSPKLLLLLFLSFFPTSFCFYHVAVPRRHALGLRLMMNQEPPEDFFQEFDVEAARQQLESLLEGSSNSGNTAQASAPEEAVFPSVQEHATKKTKPLTLMGEKRRQAEISLLVRLKHGEQDATEALWSFWFQERGPKPAALLEQADAWTVQPKTWDAAERLLQQLIVEFEGWAEPLNRLATLYYLQGRLHEAEKLCLQVLAIKPWHFGALSGIVTVYAGSQQPEKAREWAAHRIPTDRRRRAEWVRKAVQAAETALQEAQTRLKDEYFGVPDQHDEENWEAWQ